MPRCSGLRFRSGLSRCTESATIQLPVSTRGTPGKPGGWDRKDGEAWTGRRGGEMVDLETGRLGNKQGRGRGDRMDLLSDEAVHRQSYDSE